MNKEPQSESLWLDESEPVKQKHHFAAKKLLKKKSIRTIQSIFSTTNNDDKESKSHRKLISTPFGFNHIAHIDAAGSFGLERAFESTDVNMIPQFVEDSEAHDRSVKLTSCAKMQDRPTSIAGNEDIVCSKPFKHSFTAFSSFRTVPTPPAQSPVSEKIKAEQQRLSSSTDISPPLRQAQHRGSSISSTSFSHIAREDSVFTNSTISSTPRTSICSSPAQTVPYKKGLINPLLFHPKSPEVLEGRKNTVDSILIQSNASSRRSRCSVTSTLSGSRIQQNLDSPFSMNQEAGLSFTDHPITQKVEENEENIKLEKLKLPDIQETIGTNKQASKSTVSLLDEPKKSTGTAIIENNARELKVRSVQSTILSFSNDIYHANGLQRLLIANPLQATVSKGNSIPDYIGELETDKASACSTDDELEVKFRSLIMDNSSSSGYSGCSELD